MTDLLAKYRLMLTRQGPINMFNHSETKTKVPLHAAPGDVGLMSVDFETGILLKNFVEHKKPKVIVELGTHRGYSTSWLLMGTQIVGEGSIDTYECMPEGYYGPMYYDEFDLPKENLKYHEIPGGIWMHQDKLPPSVDLVYHDTSHLLDPTMKEMDLLLPRLAAGGMILFDDMDHPGFRPMQKYLYRLFSGLNEEYDFTVVHIGHGLGIAEKKS